MVRKAEAGDPADLEVWRDGKVETASTTLDERPRPDLQANYFSFLRGSEDLDGDGDVDLLIGPDNLDGLQEKIQEYFDGDEWKERHERMQRLLHERRPDMKALEERLDSLKERLAELESRRRPAGGRPAGRYLVPSPASRRASSSARRAISRPGSAASASSRAWIASS